jgi:3-oxoacyl-[acyl-carrier-protein] synthase-3
MNGREVFRHAIHELTAATSQVLAQVGLGVEDVDWLVPHQANIRILDGVGRRLEIPPERVVVTVDRHANTSAASIPLALHEARRTGRIKPGDLVMMVAFGAGLTWASAFLKY